MRTRTWITVAAVLAALALAGCGAEDGQGDAGPAAGRDTIRFVTPYRVKSLDPVTQGLWAPEWGYGELLMRATEEGRVEPWLLERLDTADAVTWTLTLRRGVRFQHGAVLDAAALKAVLDRALAGSGLLAANLPGATTAVGGEWTVTLRATAPVANLPHLLADEQGAVVYDPAAVPPGTDPATLIGKGVYTGPFEVTALTADEMTLTRDPDYWGGHVGLAQARVRFVPDGQARVLAVRNGEADVALYPPTELVRQPGGGATAVAARQPLQQLRAIFNTRTATMRDEAVRRAFALGVDYRQIAEDVLDGLYTTATGLYPQVAGYAVAAQRTDAAEAGHLLESAGWRMGGDGVRAKDGQRLTVALLTYPQQPDTKTIAVAMQAQLKPVGFDVQISEVDSNYEAMKRPSGWDVGLSFDGTLGYTYDPIAPLRDFLTTRGAKNFGAVSDAELDRLVTAVGSTVDDAARRPLLVRAQEQIAAHGYTVVVAHRSSKAVVGPAFRGYVPSSVLHHLTARTAAG
ncbi:ABC transporter substrate-binding protein [Allorhizocola rhizosphaerae]|uniref:ABC transporter substrate-binding protein n=1 Tax=Allorhizocola rhizosphaerae TaxID=1872709 RepID=UPI0013C2E9FF|nr:ABC transporter substrate-binding protein [Allorhizocola rhizosphaerae]